MCTKHSKMSRASCCFEDEIVISGISGRFPNSDNVTEFSKNLYDKVDMVDDDERRWKHINPDIPIRFGKVKNLDKFDASFFGIHSNQAELMDPQGRVLLEHAYEAVLDAGISPKTFRESRTGVFIGCCQTESEDIRMYGKSVRAGMGLSG